MTPLRTVIAGLFVATSATPAIADIICMQPAEKAAFEVHSLQSAPMVAALSCRQDEEYNGFVRRFQRDLANAHQAVQAHFLRIGGGTGALAGQLTDLANAHSQAAIRQGPESCRNITPSWREVMALGSGRDLAWFTMLRNVTRIYAAETCPAGSPPPGLQQVLNTPAASPPR